MVLDNYGTHKHPNVRAWLQRHPRFICHFVPTSCSWLNLIERWFGELTSKRVRRGSFFSVADLQQAIQEFLAAWNEAPQPLRLDRYRGIHRRQTLPLPPDSRTDQTRLHSAACQKKEDLIVNSIRGHYTSCHHPS